MKITVHEGGRECEVIDFMGLRSRRYVKIPAGFWVGDSGNMATIGLSMRLEASVERDVMRSQVNEKLHQTGPGMVLGNG